jgi:hypothetical protein
MTPDQAQQLIAVGKDCAAGIMVCAGALWVIAFLALCFIIGKIATWNT